GPTPNCTRPPGRSSTRRCRGSDRTGAPAAVTDPPIVSPMRTLNHGKPRHAARQPVYAGDMDRERPDYGPDVEVRRSRRRRRTVSARAEGSRVVVMIPDDLPPAEERRQVREMVDRVRAKVGNNLDNSALEARARRLARTVLDGRPNYESIKWV